MTTGFFGDTKPIRYEGPQSTNPRHLPQGRHRSRSVHLRRS